MTDNALIFVLATTAGIVFGLAIWVTPRVPVQTPWKDLIEALERSSSSWNKLLFFAALLASLWRSSIWACVLLYLGLIGSAIWIIGGFQLPQAIKAIREVLLDFYDFRSTNKHSPIKP